MHIGGIVVSIVAGAIIDVVVVLGVVLGYYYVGSRRKAKVTEFIKAARKELISFQTTLSPADALQVIVRFAPTAQLAIEDLNEQEGWIILGRDMKMTQFHNGFWLSVYVSQDAPGITTVQVGIKPKVYLAAFTLNIYRNQAVDRMQRFFAQEQIELSLLRAASAPTTPTETLLRPTEGSTATDGHLLRASQDSQA